MWIPPVPWTAEYQQRRESTLRSLIADPDMLARFAAGAPLPPAYALGLDERCIELPWLLSQLPAGDALVLDAGSSLNNVVMLDQPLLGEKRLHIVTLAPERDSFWRRGISYIFEDLRALPFRDGIYDIVISVSTLEHVGCDNSFYGAPGAAEKLFDFPIAVREMSRVLRPGGLLLLTVPYGTYQFHGAFQQFDRSRLSIALNAFGPARVSERFYRYSASGWQLARDEDCSDAEYVAWVSELMRTGKKPDELHHEADYAAAARAVACVKLIKA
jgi:SAM-dependent methyltransferase